ncbi:hypothetical protein B296_00054120 [Ensete ventricosum]|uniref:Uncharacterized protein n=1 Tax=Ensete ventricosum TaxID=4639 RepID=A0A426XYM5_ENSVE|nr:hypothetical protein B296_00054120 [Ensete ventricosum]
MALIEAWRSIDWERESYPAYEDFWAMPFFALLFPAVRLFLDRVVFEVSYSRLAPLPLSCILPCRKILKVKRNMKIDLPGRCNA